MRELVIGNPGIASSVQDVGRAGVQHIGISPSGAMDPFALASGQHQLGHKNNEAAIEIAYGYFSAISSHDCQLVITGAPCELRIGSDVSPSEAIHTISAGQQILMSPGYKGVYSYLHISGGIDTPIVFNSRSTSPREGIGGHHGRLLKARDRITLGSPLNSAIRPNPNLTIAEPSEILMLRFIPGFQYESISHCAREALVSETFCVSANSNRMGIVLSGKPLDTGIQKLQSEATCHGAIQIPPDGQPIVLMADRQTVGGYPKPGAVILSDCVRLAQARPGQNIRFVSCSPEEADRIQWLEHNYLLERLR